MIDECRICGELMGADGASGASRRGAALDRALVDGGGGRRRVAVRAALLGGSRCLKKNGSSPNRVGRKLPVRASKELDS
jgi:hypothetical protein